MTEPRNAIVKQYQEYFTMEGCELEFQPDALQEIANKILSEDEQSHGRGGHLDSRSSTGTGVRALRSIIEDLLLDLRFQLPTLSADGPVKVTLDAEAVRKEKEPEVKRKAKPPKKSSKISRAKEPEPEPEPEERESA